MLRLLTLGMAVLGALVLLTASYSGAEAGRGYGASKFATKGYVPGRYKKIGNRVVRRRFTGRRFRGRFGRRHFRGHRRFHRGRRARHRNARFRHRSKRAFAKGMRHARARWGYRRRFSNSHRVRIRYGMPRAYARGRRFGGHGMRSRRAKWASGHGRGHGHGYRGRGRGRVAWGARSSRWRGRVKTVSPW